MKVKNVSSWGRISEEPHKIVPMSHQARSLVTEGGSHISYGMGRSYGDACLNPGGGLWLTRTMDRLLGFNPKTGKLTCEAGVLLGEIQAVMVQHGWMLAVTPGTQFVTVGGAIANDVHGKNHHRRGTFGDNVTSIRLLRTTGELIECSPEHNTEWYEATVGGIGLTGVIVEAELQLIPVQGPWLNTESIPFDNLASFFQLSDDSETDWEYCVSWIDCVAGAAGKGIFIRGNHSPALSGPIPSSSEKIIPFVPPISLVNNLSLRAFNKIYYQAGKFNAGKTLSHYRPFFYPLDSIREWNRMYGPNGFYQYQCVVPRQLGESAIEEILDEIARSGSGSFLAVLKTFGDRNAQGMLSFAQPGITLALDFANKGEQTHRLFSRLDAIVAEAGGRLYLAKDARMPKALFEAGYPKLDKFLQFRDPGISSAMSRRLMDF